ncbi:MAG: shikimate dehydrogenase [Saprospiraceae bacterium]
MKLGLIGFPLSHSFSPGYFSEKFKTHNLPNHEYKAYPIEDISQLLDILDQGVTGLNITIPYKEQILPYLDIISNDAYEIGAVNTLKIENGKLAGYNTDVIGFEKSLLKLLGNAKIESALILGTGGAAKAVQFVLKKLSINYQIVSRKASYLNYKDLQKQDIIKSQLIINTTPLGMYPHVDKCPDIPYEYLSSKHFLYDLVYNPEKTLFLNNGDEKGSKTKNGYDMLIIQAEESWKIWNK